MNNEYRFDGTWLSAYEYPSTSRGGNFTSKQQLKAQQDGYTVILESLPGAESYVIIRLKIDEQNDVATGSWQETTNPAGHYKGATYHGVIQLLIGDDKKELVGKWLGFGKNKDINTGLWKLKKLAHLHNT
jgi:hypothetical protein